MMWEMVVLHICGSPGPLLRRRPSKAEGKRRKEETIVGEIPTAGRRMNHYCLQHPSSFPFPTVSYNKRNMCNHGNTPTIYIPVEVIVPWHDCHSCTSLRQATNLVALNATINCQDLEVAIFVKNGRLLSRKVENLKYHQRWP